MYILSHRCCISRIQQSVTVCYTFLWIRYSGCNLLTERIHFQHIKVISIELSMHMLMRGHLLIVLWHGVVIANLIYNERIVGDNCTYIHGCSFDVIPARSLVECAIKVSLIDSGLLVYDTAEGTCSVCHPTQPGVSQLARGQRFYIGGTFPLCDLSVTFMNISTVSFQQTKIISITCHAWGVFTSDFCPQPEVSPPYRSVVFLSELVWLTNRHLTEKNCIQPWAICVPLWGQPL